MQIKFFKVETPRFTRVRLKSKRMRADPNDMLDGPMFQSRKKPYYAWGRQAIFMRS